MHTDRELEIARQGLAAALSAAAVLREDLSTTTARLRARLLVAAHNDVKLAADLVTLRNQVDQLAVALVLCEEHRRGLGLDRPKLPIDPRD